MPKKYTQEEYKQKVLERYGDTIDLSDFKYVNTRTKGKFRCNVCGYVWEAKPYSVLAGHGCRKCYDRRNSSNRTLSLEEINGRIPDNIKVIGEYVNTKTKCLVRCEECGHEWRVLPSDLCRGHGCPKCNDSWNKRRKTREEFIREMDERYNGEYAYLIDTDTVKTSDMITYICPKHGEVTQLVSTHVRGNGCPYCMESGLEKRLRVCLERNGIEYVQWYRDKWLRKQSLDFYLPDYAIGIEVHGIQHFKPRDMFGGEEGLKVCQERDMRKKRLCKENGVYLIYYIPEEFNNCMEEGDIYFNEVDKLIKYIKENG